ncbi:hypothetical protein P4O66_001094 [Electrophorus voltai]|uniref:Uncharacterized protein n=1 Tax=Electrophorus voltai TaxID=2609070 RepID=A0AAD8ZAB7_9TELE|nr:hypothetical protein P4O66_001094 [Electrophorus voltai]
MYNTEQSYIFVEAVPSSNGNVSHVPVTREYDETSELPVTREITDVVKDKDSSLWDSETNKHERYDGHRSENQPVGLALSHSPDSWDSAASNSFEPQLESTTGQSPWISYIEGPDASTLHVELDLAEGSSTLQEETDPKDTEDSTLVFPSRHT